MLSRHAFLEVARAHQRSFLHHTLGVESTDPKRVLLPPLVASKGGNFIQAPPLLAIVREHLRLASPSAPFPSRALTMDALRSEHIAFNLIAPLWCIADARRSVSFLQELIGLPFATVDDLRVEYAPPGSRDLLEDNTCFDAFMALTCSDGSRHALGIEVKYTEGSYPWGATEKRRMFAPRSAYSRLTSNCALYRKGALDLLRTPHLKQMWRNQLLGECLLLAPLGFTSYQYVLLYPALNAHWQEVDADYRQVLQQGTRLSRYQGITYETWLGLAARHSLTQGEPDWVAYCLNRYIFPEPGSA